MSSWIRAIRVASFTHAGNDCNAVLFVTLFALIGGGCVASRRESRTASATSATCGTPFYRDPSLNRAFQDWYAKFWRGFRYAPLCDSQPKSATLRFVVLPTFKQPIGIELVRSEVTWHVRSKRLFGMGGYDPRGTEIDTTFSLSTDDTAEFNRLLAASGLLDAPTREPTNWTCDDNCMVFDGTRWIFEWWENGRYHVVDREAPGRKRHPELWAFGDWLVRISRVVSSAHLDEYR